MRKVKSQKTMPELLFQTAIKQRGFRVRRNDPKVKGKPDLVFPEGNLVVFIDGDFWHGNQWRRRRLASLEQQFSISRRKKWTAKIRRNMERDAVVTSELTSDGWKVLRFWESDVMSNLDWCVSVTANEIQSGLLRGSNLVAQKTFAEFFAGIGLIRLGLEKQGWKVLFANDNDPQKKELYQSHFEDAERHFNLKDVNDLSVAEIPSVTLASASFPCNDLSLAGSRGGLSAKNSSAFWPFINLIARMGERKPPVVLLENVPGFITSHDGKDFRQALMALNKIGYVVDAFLLDAVNFVPQSRQRLFVIGVLTTLPYSFPSPPPNLESDLILRPRILSSFIRNNSDILWSLRTLPAPPQRSLLLEGIIEKIPDDHPLWWDDDRRLYLFEQFSPKHRALAMEMIKARKWSYGTIFRRVRQGKSMAELRTDGIAGCLRTPRGGSGRQILFKAGFGKYSARLLSAKECARLMGADDYKLKSDLNLNQALFGFGDAVCVPAIEWIARYYLNPLINELLRSQPEID
jgi:DNA (cytosine-5)-methyltransferase 1